ncbi:Protein kinase superfamily protein [Trifolium repens]|nr:Protein kinase superfamily protein [Trifolium repens]
MTQEYPHSLPISDTMLLFELSLACSSQDIENMTSVDIDDGFVFDIDPSLLVDNEKLVIDDLIGEGAFSSVYKGWYEDRPVAVKVLIPERTKEATPECKEKFQREVNLLSKIEHNNVIKFIGASVEPSMMLIMELMEGGSLQKNLKSIYPITLRLEQCLSYALDISQAMEYLHANGIIHRDLKPGNLLLTKDHNHVKLADFGVARDNICDQMTCEAGTYRYMAPELMNKDPLPKGAKKSYDHKADVYSFALTLWSLIKNQTPFKDRKDFMAAYATINNIRPSLDELPEDIVPLLQSCWVEDPKLRPEFKEITKTLIRILHNIYTTKITALASIKENAEGNSESEAETSRENENILNRDIETMESDGEADIAQYFRMDEKKPKKKSKIKRFFSYFRSCIAF